MLKPKREELVQLIIQKAGLPSDGSYIDYLTRQQLLELHAFLNVGGERFNIALKAIGDIKAIFDSVDKYDNPGVICDVNRIIENTLKALNIATVAEEAESRSIKNDK